MNFLYDNFISDFLVIVIEWIFQFVGEYSITIILAMLFVRFVLMPLDLKSKRSMKQMAALGPEVESLKKRYANNPEQLNKKVQQLYKERGVSTMAGCLPMLVTLLLLSAFYGALRTIATEQTMALVLGAAENGAENTQLTSWLWVRNLWQPDSGSAGIMPTATEFLSFLQQNSSDITPQAMELLKNKGLIAYSSGVLSVNEAAYNALTQAVVAANGGTGYSAAALGRNAVCFPVACPKKGPQGTAAAGQDDAIYVPRTFGLDLPYQQLHVCNLLDILQYLLHAFRYDLQLSVCKKAEAAGDCLPQGLVSTR